MFEVVAVVDALSEDVEQDAPESAHKRTSVSTNVFG
jgi:hypothetical protein